MQLVNATAGFSVVAEEAEHPSGPRAPMAGAPASHTPCASASLVAASKFPEMWAEGITWLKMRSANPFLCTRVLETYATATHSPPQHEPHQASGSAVSVRHDPRSAASGRC